MSKNITSLFCRNITHNILQKYHKYHEYLPYDVTNIIDALMLPEGALGNGICTVVAQEGPQLGRIYMIYEPNLFKPDTYVQKSKYIFEPNFCDQIYTSQYPNIYIEPDLFYQLYAKNNGTYMDDYKLSRVIRTQKAPWYDWADDITNMLIWLVWLLVISQIAWYHLDDNITNILISWYDWNDHITNIFVINIANIGLRRPHITS